MANSGERTATSSSQDPPSHLGLSILYTNARSIVNKMQELKVLALTSQPDIIALTESWTHNEISNAYLAIPGYYIAARCDRKDTQNGRGGGILIYARESLQSVETTHQSAFNQFVIIQVTIAQNQILSLVVVYRSPNSPASNNEALLEMLKSVKNPAVVLGDFNYPTANWSTLHGCATSQQLIDVSQDKFWTQYVSIETHQSGNTLDLVFSESGMVNDVRDIGRLGNSDHAILIVETNHPFISKGSSHLRFNHRRADYNKLRMMFRDCDWKMVFSSNDIETCWERFKAVYNSAVQQCIPIQKTDKKKKPPWLTNDLLKLVRQKQKAWNDHRNKRSAETWEEVKKMTKVLKKRVQKAKLNFERKLAKNAKQNPKAFYAYIGSKRANRTGVGPLQDNAGNIISDDGAQAQMLNEYYGTVFETEILPAPSLACNSAVIVEEIDINQIVVKDEIKKLKRHSAPGPDGIENVVLIEACEEIALPLVLLFQKSLQYSTVPQDWRSANVTPVFKSGNKKLVSNYRPISLTSTVSKIMESLIRSSLRSHFLNNNLINSSQQGFLERKSCLTNLLHCMEEVTSILDEGHSADILYLDFSKAFDKVQHQRLINKLQSLGIGGSILAWIKAWLSGRKQRVVLNGKHSSTISVPCSVPQGSVLGPILFIIFINDIDLCVQLIKALLLKFADDTKAIKRIESIDDCQSLQVVIDKLCLWASEWQLYFNVDKCKVLHMGRNNPKFQYKMANHPIQSAESERDLGIIVDCTAKPSLQCAKAAQKGNQVLGQLLRSFQCRSKDVLVQLFKVFVRPHLEYAVQAWSPYLTKDIEILEKVQKRMVRQIQGIHGTYEEKLSILGLTSLQARRERGDCITAFKMLKGLTRVDYRTWLSLISRTEGPQTRLSTDPLALNLPPSRLDLRKNFFSVRVPSVLVQRI